MEGIFWPVVLIVAGIVLVVLEMFVPSAGALGVFAALAFLGAVCIGFYESAYIGTGTLATIALVIPMLLAIFAQWWPHTPLGRRMLLRRAPEDANDDGDDQEEHLRSLLGKRGRAKTLMLPSGAVTIGGQTYDAVSEGLAVEPGQAVEVIALRFHRLVVRPVENDATPRPSAPDDLLSQPLEHFGLDDFDNPLA